MAGDGRGPALAAGLLIPLLSAEPRRMAGAGLDVFAQDPLAAAFVVSR